MDISITQTRPFRIRQRIVHQTFRAIERLLPRYRRAQVSVAFVTNAEITRLNSAYRHKPQPTDVLSFAERDSEAFTLNPDHLGEIVIAYPYARAQAHEQGITISQELSRLLIHGFLHLIGHDHQGSGHARRMQALEQKIMSRLS